MAQDITIAGASYPAVPSIVVPKTGGGDATFFDMSGDWSWLGTDATPIETDWYLKVDTLTNTQFHGWTPSTTAKTCQATITLSDEKWTATDLANYNYYTIWECGVDVAYQSGTTLKARTEFSRALLIQELGRRSGTWAAIEADNPATNTNMPFPTNCFLRYYGTTTGTMTYTWSASYGFYWTITAPTISSTTAASPTITPKTPVLMSRCSTTYFSTDNAALVDQANSKWWIKGKYILRVNREGFYSSFYRRLTTVINSTAPSSS